MRRPTSERKRGTYIGGPDAAAIVGAHRFRTAGDVYASVVCGHRPERNARMLRGLIMEPGLIDFAAEYRATPIARDCFFVDDKIPFARCSIDGTEPDIDRPRVIHETKTWRPSAPEEVELRWGPTDSDDVEPSAAAQCQWEMGISGAREAHVWLYLVDEDSTPRHYVLERNEARIREMRQAVEAFWWEHVFPKFPPDVAPYDPAAARAMYPTSVPELVKEPTPEIVFAAVEYAAARTMRDNAEAIMDRARGFLSAWLGRAEKTSWAADPSTGRPRGTVSFKSARLHEPATNWQQVAYRLAEVWGAEAKDPARIGRFFHGLVAEETQRHFTSRQLRVTITAPKQKRTP